MATAAIAIESRGILRVPAWDALFIALSGLHAAALFAWPFPAVLAIGVWWNCNTISHNFIHYPFFRSRFLNRLFSAYLSALLGIPQALWRDRHLAHHTGAQWKLRITSQIAAETALVLGVWACLAAWNPGFFVTSYLPGYAIGLGLCYLQGHYEHARGETSHYGRLYNLLCFNDGYHAEHHLNPTIHWNDLPDRVERETRGSRWPAPLRWLDAVSLETLERIVLRSRRLQAWVLRNHRRAFVALLPHLPPVGQVAIIGGGLFPRTAQILRELLPAARLVIVDASPRNLETARQLAPAGIEFRLEHVWQGRALPNCDLLVIPLSFDGDREAICRDSASPMLVHDWIWRRRGTSKIVSIALLKRLNLVTR